MVIQRSKLQRTAKDAVLAIQIEKELHSKKKRHNDSITSKNSNKPTPKKKILNSTPRSSPRNKINKSLIPTSPLGNKTTPLEKIEELKDESKRNMETNDESSKEEVSKRTVEEKQWSCTNCTFFNESNKRKCSMCREPRKSTTTVTIFKKRRTTRSSQDEDSEFFTPHEETELTQESPDLLVTPKERNDVKRRDISSGLDAVNKDKSLSQVDSKNVKEVDTETVSSKEVKSPLKTNLNDDLDSDSSLLEAVSFAKKDVSDTPVKEPKKKETQQEESFNPFILNTPSTQSTVTFPVLSNQKKSSTFTPPSQTAEQKQVVEDCTLPSSPCRETTFTSPTQAVDETKQIVTEEDCAVSVPVNNVSKDKFEKPTPKALIFTPNTTKTTDTIIKPTPEPQDNTYQPTNNHPRQEKFIQDMINLVSNYTQQSNDEKSKLQQLLQIQQGQITCLTAKLEKETTRRVELERGIRSWWKERSNGCNPPSWMEAIIEDKEEEDTEEENTNSQIRSIVVSAAAIYKNESLEKDQELKDKVSNHNISSTSSSTKTITNPYKQKPYKYQQVIRNKDIRRGLPGHECEHCKDFINAVCGDVLDKQQFLNYCSRHKAEFSPDPTPDGFWELSFADSIRNRG